jgi:hypothetical protein
MPICRRCCDFRLCKVHGPVHRNLHFTFTLANTHTRPTPLHVFALAAPPPPSHFPQHPSQIHAVVDKAVERFFSRGCYFVIQRKTTDDFYHLIMHSESGKRPTHTSEFIPGLAGGSPPCAPTLLSLSAATDVAIESVGSPVACVHAVCVFCGCVRNYVLLAPCARWEALGHTAPRCVPSLWGKATRAVRQLPHLGWLCLRRVGACLVLDSVPAANPSALAPASPDCRLSNGDIIRMGPVEIVVVSVTRATVGVL